jgi:hypothetical protein
MLDDLDLGHPEDPGGSPRQSSARPKIALVLSAVLLAALLAGLWIYRLNKTQVATSPPPAPAAPVEQAPADASLGAGPTVPLPPLSELDGFIRDALGQLSSARAITTWLGTDHLAEQFTSIVQGVSEGRAPMRQLARLHPTAPFTVIERNGRTVIDPASYRRYGFIADAVASLDPLACSRLYGTLKPRLEEAYAQLGIPDGTLDRAVEGAIIALLKTPVPSGDVSLHPKGALYVFDDPALEALTPAQKLLLRTGPDNAHRIQERLREIAAALGVPPGRLP